MRLPRIAIALFVLLLSVPCAFASTDIALDDAAIAQLETRAEHASTREQCFLYTELVHAYTQVAGRQMAAGDMDKASSTLKRVQTYAARIHIGLAKDTKKLKDAEMLMHTATHNLSGFLHYVSSDDKAVVESTLKQLDKVNDELLAQVFAH